MPHVTRILECHPLDLGDDLEPWLDAQVVRFIVSPIQQKRFHLDVVSVVISFPVFKGADNDELRRALPVLAC